MKYGLNLFARIFCGRTQVCFRLLLISLLGVKPVFADQDWRCSVDLIFASENGGSVANYVLTLQVKNNTGRDITGVSVIYKDAAKEVIGNTLLKCGVNELSFKYVCPDFLWPKPNIYFSFVNLFIGNKARASGPRLALQR